MQQDRVRSIYVRLADVQNEIDELHELAQEYARQGRSIATIEARLRELFARLQELQETLRNAESMNRKPVKSQQ